MNARRLIPAAVASLSMLVAGATLAAPAALAEETCPNAASRQGPSLSLPDCRVYEQVTPISKGDSQDLFPSIGLGGLGNAIEDVGVPAEDGNAFLLEGPISFAGGDAFKSTYVFERGPQGWTTNAISPGPGVHEVLARVFSSDLSKVGVTDLQFNHLPGQPEDREVANLVGPVGGPYTTLSTVPTVTGLTSLTAGASADLSHVVVESENHELAPGDTSQDEGSQALYQWSGGGLRLVNVKTDGSLLSPCGAILGLGGTLYAGATHNAVSGDGSRIIFTAPDPNGTGVGCWNPNATPQENPPELYVRVNGASTVEVSAPDAGVSDPAGAQPAAYVGASTDGSKVFFITKTELTPDDSTHAYELYEYDSEAPEGQRLTRVSSGESGNAEGAVNAAGGAVAAISSDGSTVYFFAFGKLAQGASALDSNGSQGVNLYRYDTSTRRTTFVTKFENPNAYYPTTVSGNGFWTGYFGGGGQGQLALLANAEWYTTADGRYLLFGSNQPLTGFDSKPAPGAACEEIPLYSGGKASCGELFRYDATTSTIECVSCVAGRSPVGNAEFARDAFEGPESLPTRGISEDGNYVFFDTTSALVPQTSGGVLHVYEWHEGQISLISSAGDDGNSYFLGSSADGRDVFFGTHAQLAAQDTDFAGDLYDARAGGGFVGIAPSACTGTGCQGVPGAPPIFATPASVTFEGVGNFPPGLGKPVESKRRAKPLTKAQKLANALKICRRERGQRKRARCKASAMARYGARKSTKLTRRGK